MNDPERSTGQQNEFPRSPAEEPVKLPDTSELSHAKDVSLYTYATQGKDRSNSCHTDSTGGKEKAKQSQAEDSDLDGYECSICLEIIHADAKIRDLPCGHAFHVPCVDRWLLDWKARCPVCKSPLAGS